MSTTNFKVSILVLFIIRYNELVFKIYSYIDKANIYLIYFLYLISFHLFLQIILGIPQ